MSDFGVFKPGLPDWSQVEGYRSLGVWTPDVIDLSAENNGFPSYAKRKDVTVAISHTHMSCVFTYSAGAGEVDPTAFNVYCRVPPALNTDYLMYPMGDPADSSPGPFRPTSHMDFLVTGPNPLPATWGPFPVEVQMGVATVASQLPGIQFELFEWWLPGGGDTGGGPAPCPPVPRPPWPYLTPSAGVRGTTTRVKTNRVLGGHGTVRT